VINTLWDQHDVLADLMEQSCVLPRTATHATSVRETLTETCKEILRGAPERFDYENLLDPPARVKTAETRHFVWSAQAIFHGHACAVGQRIVMGRSHSPLVEQLKTRGLQASGVNYATFSKRMRESTKTLDVLIHNETKFFEVILIQGYTFDEARKVNPSLTTAVNQKDLFASRKLYLPGATARSRDVRALLNARDLLKAAFPSVKLRALFLITSSYGNVPHFQAVDLSNVPLSEVAGERVRIDEYEPCYTSADYRVTVDALLERMDRPMLTKPPFDRSVRMHLLVQDLCSRQLSSKSLTTVKMSDVGKRVSIRHGLHYEPNLLRHDFEDGLERRGYVRRLWEDETCFALTPKGFGHALLMKWRGSDRSELFAQRVVQHEVEQRRRFNSN